MFAGPRRQGANPRAHIDKALKMCHWIAIRWHNAVGRSVGRSVATETQIFRVPARPRVTASGFTPLPSPPRSARVTAQSSQKAAAAPRLAAGDEARSTGSPLSLHADHTAARGDPVSFFAASLSFEANFSSIYASSDGIYLLTFDFCHIIYRATGQDVAQEMEGK